VSVTGEVRNPGTYAWFPGMTVRRLIAAAGGLTPDASARPVLSSRGEMTMEDPVKPGEALVVHRSPM
jgi:protein involved in polysaccharide export with SLBB domain